MNELSSVYIQEQNKYSQLELMTIFNLPENETIEIIRRLKSYGILKAIVTKDDDGQDISDYSEEYVDVSDVVEGDTRHSYVFSFVGLIVVCGLVIKSYPKYIKSTDKPEEKLKQIVKVIEKYNRSKRQVIKLHNEYEKNSSFNLLSSIVFLLRDYYENGSYENTIETKEINGVGQIDWNRTINDTFAILCEGRPCYTELVTRRREFNEYDYFKLLHEYVITKCSKELEQAGLFGYFDDINPIEISDLELDDFGELNYILYRIENELNVQFNTRKQNILKTIFAYLCQNNKFDNDDSLGLYGTNSFNLVWEDVCKDVLNNKLGTKLENLDIDLSDRYREKKNSVLLDLIDKPIWNNDSWKKGHEANKTLLPDIITISKNKENWMFIIFDAKYYDLHMEEFDEIKNNPGIQDVTKQYLYELAYKDFIKDHNMMSKNCFLFPTEGDEIVNKGYVTLKILGDLGLNQIETRLLPAKRMYDLYLNNALLNIIELELD